MKFPFEALSKKTELDLVVKQGRWFNSENFSLKVLELAKIPNYNLSTGYADNAKKPLKLAVSVGLKLSKKAVERNRAKRVTRAAIQLALGSVGSLNLNRGYFLLLVPKPAVLTKKSTEVSEELKLLFKKINLY